MKICLTNW